MEPAFITAIVAGLATFGGGAWKLIDRADKKRERREAAVEALLTALVTELKVQLAKQASDFERERRQAKRNMSRKMAAAGKWREQLLVHDIKPDPAEWPEDEHDATE